MAKKKRTNEINVIPIKSITNTILFIRDHKVILDSDLANLYQDLFKVRIEPDTLEEIRVAANKDQVLGNDKFKQEIEQMLKRRITTYPHGGDRKSELFKQTQQ